MTKLSELPNIGEYLTQKLQEVGIESIEDLMRMGSRDAFLRLKKNNPDVCINTLMALEGAIKGVRWHHLSEDDKRELKRFYRQSDA